MEIHGTSMEHPSIFWWFFVIFGREVMRLADATSSAKRRRDALGSFWPGEGCQDVNMVNPINNPSPIKVCQCLYHIFSYFMIIMIGFIVNSPVISKKIARDPLISRLLSMKASPAPTWGMPLQHAMFYGPPGTGKTMVAQRFAEYSGVVKNMWKPVCNAGFV